MERERSIDLLRLEMDTLWGSDLYGRPCHPHPLVALAVADDGQEVRFGPGASREDREALSSLLASGKTLEECRERLPRSTQCGGWLGYVFTDPLSPLSTPDLRILTSRDGETSALEAMRPEPWWEIQEWADLIAGRLGPLAIGLAEGRVAALCHTPVASPSAAEAGVWTHPEARGRGYAASVTAAWSRVAASRFDTLFYSTEFGNAASQAVARKLGVRPIGAIWQIREEETSVDGDES